MKRRILLPALASTLSLPSLARNTKLHVGFLADTGTGGSEQFAVAHQLAQMHQKKPFDLILLGGDNIYTAGEINKIKAVFEDPYQPLLKAKVPFFPVLGNHDIRTNNGDDEVKYFKMPGRYYSFIRGPVQFFALNTNALDANQLTWLDTELGRSRSPWKIVYGHHNVFTTFTNYVDSGQLLGRTLSPLLSKHRVNLYLNGHVHGYERTLPQDGVVYVTSGGGGQSLYPLREGAPFNAFSRNTYEFVSLEISDQSIQLNAIDTTGVIFDRFLLKR